MILWKLLKKMAELCFILRNKRLKRGAIDFDFPESKVRLDENGKPLEIYRLEKEPWLTRLLKNL